MRGPRPRADHGAAGDEKLCYAIDRGDYSRPRPLKHHACARHRHGDRRPYSRFSVLLLHVCVIFDKKRLKFGAFLDDEKKHHASNRKVQIFILGNNGCRPFAGGGLLCERRCGSDF